MPASPSAEVKPKKRVKKASAPLSLNDNLHSSYLYGLKELMDRYVTVDKVDDDKERDGESKAKKAKVDKQNETEDGGGVDSPVVSLLHWSSLVEGCLQELMLPALQIALRES